MRRSIERGSSQRSSRIFITSFTACCLVLVLAAWWYYDRQRETLESSISAELAAIADGKARQIANWRSERIGDGNVLLSAPVAARAERILSGAASAADRTELQDVGERFVGAFHYAGAALVDRNGELRFEVNRGRTNRTREWLSNAAASNNGTVLLSEFYLDSGAGQPRMSLSIPISRAGS